MTENLLQEALTRLRRHLPEPLWDAANGLTAKWLSQAFADKYLPVRATSLPKVAEAVGVQTDATSQMQLYLIVNALLRLDRETLNSVMTSPNPHHALMPYILEERYRALSDPRS